MSRVVLEKVFQLACDQLEREWLQQGSLTITGFRLAVTLRLADGRIIEVYPSGSFAPGAAAVTSADAATRFEREVIP